MKFNKKITWVSHTVHQCWINKGIIKEYGKIIILYTFNEHLMIFEQSVNEEYLLNAYSYKKNHMEAIYQANYIFRLFLKTCPCLFLYLLIMNK